MVHIASCVGNVVSRLFIKFECNEGESSSTDYGDGKLADVSSQAKRNPFRCECSWRVCRVRRTDRWSPIRTTFPQKSCGGGMSRATSAIPDVQLLVCGSRCDDAQGLEPIREWQFGLGMFRQADRELISSSL
jgi:hypothetical protein